MTLWYQNNKIVGSLFKLDLKKALRILRVCLLITVINHGIVSRKGKKYTASIKVLNRRELQRNNKAKSITRQWQIIGLLKRQKSAQIATKPGQVDADKKSRPMICITDFRSE